MSPSSPRWLVPITVVALTILVWGWWHFWFLCDDAFIAFRYVDNSQRGWGYVWNPPPFRPVEGYTSFLWVALLDLVWTWTGTEPPKSAPWLGLAASTVTVLAAIGLLWRTALPEPYDRHRAPLVAVATLGVVTNRSFLMWTSSGLETPLFICSLVCWFAWAAGARRGPWWLVGGMTIATVSALTRPDGLLYLAATPVIAAAAWWGGRPVYKRDPAALLPALAIPAHFVWRFQTYGEWLPNTYYAKVGEPWINGGGNHFWLWVLENGLFFWAPLALAALWAQRAHLTDRATWERNAPVLLAVGAVVAHGAYYVLRVGGDHFEFRIYQHAIPLLFALALWLVTRTRARVLTAGLILGLLVEATWLIPWPDYIQTMHLRRNSDIGKLHRPMADKLPIVFYPWAWKHDDLEAWCVKHLLATPYQTHKWFRLNYQRAQPPRSEALAKLDDFAWHPRNRTKKAYPITSYRSVGVTGWALPNVAILDEYGLNDLVIARNMPREGRFRYSAHDRFPPPGYLDCFRPNVRIEDKLLKFTKRDPPMKPADIKDCEDRFLLQVTEGVPALTEAELEAWHAEKAAEREAEKARKAAKQAADSPVEADAPDDEAGDPEE